MKTIILILITVIVSQIIYSYLKKYHRITSEDIRIQFIIDIAYMTMSSIAGVYLVRIILYYIYLLY